MYFFLGRTWRISEQLEQKPEKQENLVLGLSLLGDVVREPFRFIGIDVAYYIINKYICKSN